MLIWRVLFFTCSSTYIAAPILLVNKRRLLWIMGGVAVFMIVTGTISWLGGHRLELLATAAEQLDRASRPRPETP